MNDVKKLLNGEVVLVTDNEHFKKVFNALCEILGEKDVSAEDFITASKQYLDKSKKDKVQYQLISLTSVYGMVILNATISFTGKPPRPFTANGLFGYAYNFTDPEFSELGYTFYKNTGTKENPIIHRVG